MSSQRPPLPLSEPAANLGIIAGRLRPPRLGLDAVVVRSSAQHRRDELPGAAVTLVVAAAGYGKTTLLAKQLLVDGRTVVWLSLDARDDHPRRFLDTLLASIAVATGTPTRHAPADTALTSDVIAQTLAPVWW